MQVLICTTTLNIHEFGPNPSLPFTSERKEHQRESFPCPLLSCEVAKAPIWSPKSLFVGQEQGRCAGSAASTPSAALASSKPPFYVHQGRLLGRS